MSKTKEGERHIRFIQMRYCVRRNSDCRGIKECDEYMRHLAFVLILYRPIEVFARLHPAD